MTPEEAAILLSEKIQIYKSWKESLSKEKGEHPDFFEGYCALCEDYFDIRSHSVKGVFPHKIFRERSPHQTDQEFKFVKNNYQQTTNFPMFMDTVTSVKRSFNDVESHVKYDEETPKGQEYKEYVTTQVPIYYSVENYVTEVMPENKLRDAMGVTVIKPKRTIKFVQEGEDILAVEDDQTLREPEIFYIPTPKIWSPPHAPHYVLLTNEKSVVDDGNKKVRKGMVIWIIDDMNFFIFAQTGDINKYEFELKDQFEHKSGQIPVNRFKGVAVINEAGDLVYQSPFLYAVPSLNVVVLDQSYLQISKDKTAFPVQVMIGNECEFLDPATNSQCIEGSIEWQDEHGAHRKDCPKCKGTGRKNRISPQGTLLLRGRTREGGEAERVSEALTYVSPDTTTMEFLKSEIAANTQNARSILHLNTDSDKAGENVVQSASYSKALTAFIKPQSDQMYAMYEWILNIMGMQRYGIDYPKPDVVYPKTFEFLTEEDYLLLIKQAQEAGAPPFVIHSLIWKYLSAVFYTDSKAAEIASIIMKTDRLVAMSDTQISNALVSDLVAPWEVILHQSSFELIGELMMANPGYLDMEYSEQRELLIQSAKDKANEVNPVLLQTGGSVNALKDTVGGLSGMIEITKAVAEGYYDLDAAVALVQDRFSLSEADARKQLGTPNPILVQNNGLSNG